MAALAVLAALASSCITHADVIITVQPPTPQQMIPPTCTVDVCCNTIGTGGGSAWHCFTRCTRVNPDGTTHITACRGGPSGLLTGAPMWPEGAPGVPNVPPACSGWTVFNGAWGPIDTYCGPYTRGHPDWQDTPLPCTGTGGGGNCAVCDCIELVMCLIQTCCVRYELLPQLYGYNSNSVASTAIDECIPSGFPQPLPYPEPPLGAPGWNILIPMEACDTCNQ